MTLQPPMFCGMPYSNMQTHYPMPQQQWHYPQQPPIPQHFHSSTTPDVPPLQNAHLSHQSVQKPRTFESKKFNSSNYPRHDYLTASHPIQQPALFFCTPCDKEFTSSTAFEEHKKTHEPCRHPGCNFSASKKVVVAHFHSSHGLYSGSGYKLIEVEGQKFNVLLGTAPEEIAQWRADRRHRFPTAANVMKKQQEQDELKSAGGLTEESQLAGSSSADKKRKNGKKRKPDQVGVEQQGGKKKPCTNFSKGRCKHGDRCRYSHSSPSHANDSNTNGDVSSSSGQVVCLSSSLDNPTQSNEQVGPSTSPVQRDKKKPRKSSNTSQPAGKVVGGLRVPPPLVGGAGARYWVKATAGRGDQPAPAVPALPRAEQLPPGQLELHSLLVR
eukprot:CAMPEP_0170094978 /NCGR_PEP_ID=MMETSP0019_2-20121128/27629_1 /TAXON_ID=98059 /ORGANISM="Dinobryon sp., Strain UTEXLB2267" /LENGTH=382 /DNA_ID=CAMNT_0010316515 /DNA_START=226 /DNA_END=1375 /DNA_ORIENTATION=+